jgi:hypothetical protein
MDNYIRHGRLTNEDTTMDDPDSTEIQQPVYNEKETSSYLFNLSLYTVLK